MKLEAEIADPRRAGRVARYHTWPHIREQTVAEHSWQVARIVRAVWPAAPLDLIYYCLFHDLGEVAAGDPPYPAKRMNPDLAREHAKIERSTYLAMAVPWGLPPIYIDEDSLEYLVFRAAHYIEMWEWALDEIALGNQNASLVARRCAAAMGVAIVRVQDREEALAGSFRLYVKRRSEIQDEIGRFV